MPDPQQPPPANEHLQAILQKAYEALGKIIDDIVVLRVTTVVGTVTATDADDPSKQTRITVAPDGQMVAHSAINMALGDANIVVSKGFMNDGELKALHAQALADSRAIRKESIEMLHSAIQAILSRL